jgi:hypothetical protein
MSLALNVGDQSCCFCDTRGQLGGSHCVMENDIHRFWRTLFLELDFCVGMASDKEENKEELNHIARLCSLRDQIG